MTSEGTNITIEKLNNVVDLLRRNTHYQEPCFYTSRRSVNKIKYILYVELLRKQNKRFRIGLLNKTNRRYKYIRSTRFNDWEDPTSKAYNPNNVVGGLKFHISDAVPAGEIFIAR
jgi:hypothetical protein